jgi:hypothetical protein
MTMTSFLRRLRNALNPPDQMADVPEWQRAVVRAVRPFTMGSEERLLATIGAVEYVVAHDVPGAVVECGVWRGGQMMAASLTLKHLGVRRPLVLFDTFSGMTEPSNVDKDLEESPALRQYQQEAARPRGDRWCEATLEEVRRNLASTGYPADLVTYVSGPVEQTPNARPRRSLFASRHRLWYESTLHEPVHLFPLVAKLGVVSIDDYGHWQGAKKASTVSRGAPNRRLLHRIDYTDGSS